MRKNAQISQVTKFTDGGWNGSNQQSVALNGTGKGLEKQINLMSEGKQKKYSSISQVKLPIESGKVPLATL